MGRIVEWHHSTIWEKHTPWEGTLSNICVLFKVMFVSNITEIDTLYPSQKETGHWNHTHLGFHVFLTGFFLDFKSLTDDQKWQELSELMGICYHHKDDIGIIYSVDSFHSTNSDDEKIPFSNHKACMFMVKIISSTPHWQLENASQDGEWMPTCKEFEEALLDLYSMEIC